MNPVTLVILDGWGVAPLSEGNAIERSRMPFLEDCLRRYPSATLLASGEAVGLPFGEMGNSEVGHLTIGLGRIHYQPFPRINRSILSKDFFQNQALRNLLLQVHSRGGRVHVVGIVSTGGVHGTLDHIFAVLDLAHQLGVHRIAIHAITDGRDTPYNSAINFVERLQQRVELFAEGVIATISGRYWSMDRDTHWERTKEAFDAMVFGRSTQMSHSPMRAIQEYYSAGIYDEMIPPTVLTDGSGVPRCVVKPQDGIIFTNFRPDRIRQLASALTLDQFSEFDRREYQIAPSVSLTEYDSSLPSAVAYPPESTADTIAELVANTGAAQLHCAETEKYAHITYFLNGYREQPFPQEQRLLVPSPRVESYAKAPEMSARLITQKVLEFWRQQSTLPVLTVINFANADMVGHTGDFEATRIGVQVIDECLSQLWKALNEYSGSLVITADHGNAEEMIDRASGIRKTYHTSNPVPLYIIDQRWEGKGTEMSLSLQSPIGGLADVAPTVLELLGIPAPQSMTGKSLLSLLCASV